MVRTILALMTLLGISAIPSTADDDLSGLAVSVDKITPHYGSAAEHIWVGVEITNSSPRKWKAVFVDCFGYLGDEEVWKGIGMAEHIGAFRSTKAKATGFIQEDKHPTTLLCKIGDAFNEASPE